MRTPLGPRILGKGRALALVALVVLLAATIGAGSPRLARQTEATDGPNASLVPATSDPVDCSTHSSLCLQEGQFLISATWKKPDGSSGADHAVRLTPNSGYFWFVEPDNVELVVKTLDGRSISARYWFFSGGLTNLEVSITIADTVSGQTRTYATPQGTAFKPSVDMNVPDGLWDSGVVGWTGFTRTFPQVERFPYFCKVQRHGEVGLIVVDP